MPAKRLTLVVPGLLDPPPALRAAAIKLPRAPAMEAFIAQADHAYHGCSTLPEVLAVHARDARLINACAPLSWMAEGGRHVSGAAMCLRAEPLSLVADRDRLRLLQGDDSLPDAGECASLFASMNAHFVDDGLEFRQGPEGGWYLFVSYRLDVRTVAYDALQRRDLRDAQPTGADAPRLARWMNEIQMLLHDHPLNRAREQAGRPAFNGVWLWGAGEFPAQGITPFDAAYADDPLPRALGRHARRLPPAMRAGLAGIGDEVLVVVAQLAWPDPVAFVEGMARLEREWFAPARDLMRRGHWREFVVDGCDGRVWRCTRSQRWTRWWRRRDITRRLAVAAQD